MHHQNRWMYFHQKAAANADLSDADTFMSLVPAPYGFGLWTAHFTPLILGVPTVLQTRFDPGHALSMIERLRPTILCCVSTQLVMLANHPDISSRDLSSLRILFTGGEAVSASHAKALEERSGCVVLQFYGSNECGMISGTAFDDPPDARWHTAGKVVPEMQVRLLDGGHDVPAPGRGQPACRGPALSLGYLDDPEANLQLFTDDGWMLLGDVCEIGADGYLRVVGRTSDFIIRGGKNISASQVEADVSSHPSVTLAAAVAMPDPVFGERVCVYVQLDRGASLALSELLDYLREQGVSKELWPERLVVLEELPTAAGGKVAKGALREDARTRVEVEP